MKNWKQSEIIAVVLLVMIVGFLAYVGIVTELERDLVGEAVVVPQTADKYGSSTPYFYGGKWHNTAPSNDVPYSLITYFSGAFGTTTYFLQEFDNKDMPIGQYFTYTPVTSGATPRETSSSWSGVPRDVGGGAYTHNGILYDESGNLVSSAPTAASTPAGEARAVIDSAPAAGGGGSLGTDEEAALARAEAAARAAVDEAGVFVPPSDTTSFKVSNTLRSSDTGTSSPVAGGVISRSVEGQTSPSSGYQRIDNQDGSIMHVPKAFGERRQVVWNGNLVQDAAGNVWTVLNNGNNGQTFTRTDGAGNVHIHDYRGGSSRYTVTGSDGKVKQAQINFQPVAPEIAREITSLDPDATYAPYRRTETAAGLITGVRITDVQGGMTQTRDVSYSKNTKTITDTTTTRSASGAAVTTRTIITTQLPGSGTARWSGTTTGQPGTLVITALGETYNLAQMTRDDTNGNYKSSDGRTTLTLPAGGTPKLTLADDYDTEDHEETFFYDNRKEVFDYDDGELEDIDIYYTNGDVTTWGDNTFGAYSDRSTRRYDAKGNIVSIDYFQGAFEKRPEPGTPQNSYMRVDAVLFDANGDGVTNEADIPVLAQREDVKGRIPGGQDALTFLSDVFKGADSNGDHIIDNAGVADTDEPQGIIELTSGRGVKVHTEEAAEKAGGELGDAQSTIEFDRFINGQSAAVDIGNKLADYRSRQGISNLLFGKAFLNDWREKLDRNFAKAYLGSEYWASEICANEFDVVGDSVAGIETAGGVFQFIGVAQGERAGGVPLLCDDTGKCRAGTCRERDNVCLDSAGDLIMQNFYKITYSVRAPADVGLTPYDDEEGAISFNIIVKGKQKTASLFTEFVNLKNGESSASKAPVPSPILHYSPIVYDEVCLVFGKKPLDRKGNHVNLRCNPIVASGGSFDNFRNNRDRNGAPNPSAQPEFNSDW